MMTPGNPLGSPIIGKLRPATFPTLDDDEDSIQTPKQPSVPKSLCKSHWTSSDIDPSKYQHLLCLPHKLAQSNFVRWTLMIEASLDTVDLFEYCLGLVPPPDLNNDKTTAAQWKHSNTLVWAILTMNMTEEVVNQIGHNHEAATIWEEAHCLFVGQTLMDWTLTITNLVTKKYVDGNDLIAHIAQLKGYQLDLVMMKRDINDDLFACFLHISMWPIWNYVFASLAAKYSSSEIESQIKDEYGVQLIQKSSATAYSAKQGKKSKSCTLGEPWCLNCKIMGHLLANCWSKGGGAKGKGPGQTKSKSKNKDKEKKEKEKKGKEEEKKKCKRPGSTALNTHANRAHHCCNHSDSNDSDNSDSYHVSNMSAYMARTSFQTSPSGWILDSGALAHICKSRSAFKIFTALCGT